MTGIGPARIPGRRFLAFVAMICAALLLSAPAISAPKAYLVALDGAVGPVSADHVLTGLKRAAEAEADVVILRIDTPGGLDSAMREIIRGILASPVPVACYVAPGGARAASAGTFILYACPVAAMAPGTNLGAATPVSVLPSLPVPAPTSPEGSAPAADGQGRPADAEMAKVTNDAVAYIRSLARLNGRNADWAEKAVREAASLPADQALKMNVIDLVARNVPDLLAALDGRTVAVDGGSRTLALKGAEVVTILPDLRTQILAAITNPNIAFLLLLLGAYGLIFEFAHPGIFAPGVVGAICLVVGLYALSIIPVDFAGLALTLLGLALMVTEAFVPSFGALGIGGAVAFVLGAMMTFDTPGYRLAWPVALGAGLFSVGLFMVVLAMLVRARRRRPTTGDSALVGARARVIDWGEGGGTIEAMGEHWRAAGAGPFAPGQSVRVVARDGLTLRVEAE
jgi:membrane-bound serine protease (ClpP class)